MKTLVLAAFLSLSHIPGVIPEIPGVSVSLGKRRYTAVLKFVRYNWED